MVLMCLQTTASPEGELLQVYVRARAITCPIFQWFVCLCEIMSANCQSSYISKHSYMHNHASYMSMHLIKLLCHSYTFAFSIPMLISVKINHVNFKYVDFKTQQSCQLQNFTSPFKFKLMQSCQVNFNLFLRYNLFLLTAKWLVRIQEQLVPVNLFLLAAKRPVRVQK